MSSVAIFQLTECNWCFVSARTVQTRLTEVGYRGGGITHLMYRKPVKTNDMDDETKMLIFGTDGRKYVLCIREEVNPDCIQATRKNSTSIMIWACMSANIVGCLHVIDVPLNSRKYIDTIIQQKLLPSIRDVF